MQTKFKTRLAKGGDAHVTDATLVWDGVDDEQIKSLAARSIIIMAQAQYRAAGKVPPTDTINVADMLKREGKGGAKSTPESIAARVAKLSEADRASLLALLGKGNGVAPAPKAQKAKAAAKTE